MTTGPDRSQTVNRPPRRVPLNLTHTWESQAWQYDRPDIKPAFGIIHWTVPKDAAPVPIECLLYYGMFRDLRGILNYYPEGSPYGEQPHDLMVLVRPDARREGIGRVLIGEAMHRWPQIDLHKQAYTDSGWALAQSVLSHQRGTN